MPEPRVVVCVCILASQVVEAAGSGKKVDSKAAKAAIVEVGQIMIMWCNPSTVTLPHLAKGLHASPCHGCSTAFEHRAACPGSLRPFKGFSTANVLSTQLLSECNHARPLPSKTRVWRAPMGATHLGFSINTHFFRQQCAQVFKTSSTLCAGV